MHRYECEMHMNMYMYVCIQLMVPRTNKIHCTGQRAFTQLTALTGNWNKKHRAYIIGHTQQSLELKLDSVQELWWYVWKNITTWTGSYIQVNVSKVSSYINMQLMVFIYCTAFYIIVQLSYTCTGVEADNTTYHVHPH